MFFGLVDFGFSEDYLFDQDLLTFNQMVVRAEQQHRLRLSQYLLVGATAVSSIGGSKGVKGMLKTLQEGIDIPENFDPASEEQGWSGLMGKLGGEF